MKELCELLIHQGKFEEAEIMVSNLEVSLDELSQEAFDLFKSWIESN